MTKYNFIDATTGEILGTFDEKPDIHKSNQEILALAKSIFKFRVENGVVSVGRLFANGDKPKDQNLFQINSFYATLSPEEIDNLAAVVLIENCYLFNLRVEPVVVVSE